MDLDPSKVKYYMKILTEGCMAVDKIGEGAERKYIWDYLLKTYKDKVDYRDFLLAIRRFVIDGKMYNVDGFYSMHPEVIEEVKKRTPTPAIKQKGLKESVQLNLQKSKKDTKKGAS